MPSTNRIPNQNDLYDIFKSQVAAINEVTDIIMKSKINKKTTKRVSEVTEYMVVIGTAVIDMVTKLPDSSEQSIQKFTKFKANMVVVGNNIYELIGLFSNFNLIDYVDARLGIWRMRKTMKAIKRLVKTVGLITPTSVMLSGTVVRNITKTAILMAQMTKALKKIPLFGLGWSINRLYKVLFGHKPGVPKKPNDAGLIDIFENINSPRRIRALMKAMINVNLIVGPTKKLVGMMVLMGLALVPITLAWLTVKLMKPIIRGLLFIFTISSRHLKHIFKGSIALHFIVGSLLVFTAGMILVGIGVLLAWKPMVLAVLFVTMMVTFFALLGGTRRLVRRGAKSILLMVEAVALIGLVAIGMALLAQFVSANIPGFLIVVAYMVALVGIFFLLAAISKPIKRGGRNILRIAMCVGLLALTAIGLALLSQFIRANIGGFIMVVLWMVAMISMIKYIGEQRKAILKAESSMVTIGLFAVGLVVVAAAMMAVTHMGNMWELLSLTTIMFGVVVGLGTIAVVANNLSAEIEEGAIVMAILGGIALQLSVVMVALAAAVAIANPLLILAAVGTMTLIIVALGALAFIAGSLVMGPQAVLFLAGIAALELISLLAMTLGVTAMVIASAAKKIQSTGFTSSEELAYAINMPFAALVRGDESGENIFNILAELPNPMALAYMGAKVLMLTGTVSSIGTIANVLQHIASLNMPDPEKGYDEKGNPKGWRQMTSNDFAAASQNASVILGMSAAMFGDEPRNFTLADGTTFRIQVVDMVGLNRISFMTRFKVKRLANIVGSVGRMADVLQHIAFLNMPDPDAGYTEDGKPKGWKQMKSNDFMTASRNAGSILSFFGALFADASTPVTFGTTTFMVKPLDTSTLDNMTRSTKRKVKRLGEIVSTIGGMATTIQNIASLNMPDPNKGYDDNGKPKGYIPMGAGEFEQASINIGKIATHIIDAVASENLASKLDDMSRKAAKNFERIMNPMNSISGIVETIQLLAGGEYVKEWQDDPNNPGQRIPKTYASFSALLDKKPELTEKLTDMLTIVIGSIAQFESGDLEDILDKANDAAEDIQDVTEKISPVLNDIIGIVNESLKLPDFETVKTQAQIPTWVMRHVVWSVSDCDKTIKDSGTSVSSLTSVINFIGKPRGTGALSVVKDIVDLYNEDISKISDPKTFKTKYTGPTQVARELIESLAGATSSASAQKVQAIQSNIHETIKLMKQVGSTDMSKLKYASTMMNAIARISESIKGNFKELSKTINKDLIKAIKELKKVLDEINKNGIKTSDIGTGTDTGNESNIKGANENGSAKLDADRYKSTMKGLNRIYELDDLIDLIASCIDGSGSERSIRTKSK